MLNSTIKVLYSTLNGGEASSYYSLLLAVHVYTVHMITNYTENIHIADLNHNLEPPRSHTDGSCRP